MKKNCYAEEKVIVKSEVEVKELKIKQSQQKVKPQLANYQK